MKFDKFTYMLAPMEDITNEVFRKLCHKYGADITFTELVRVESLAKKNKSTWERLKILDGTPTIVQLIGHKEMWYKKFLSMYEPKKGFLGFNINMGCPAPNLVNNGMGCAMMKRITKARKIIEIVKDRGYEASIKLRLGLNNYERQNKAYLNLINSVDADFFIVHARDGAQSYREKADWNVFPECCATGKTIIANGDIKTKQDIEKMESYGCKGAMIGREAVKNPAIFNILKGIPAPTIDEIKKEYAYMSENDAVFRYQKNVTKHLGKDMIVDRQV